MAKNMSKGEVGIHHFLCCIPTLGSQCIKFNNQQFILSMTLYTSGDWKVDPNKDVTFPLVRLDSKTISSYQGQRNRNQSS